ncbi:MULTISPECIES: ABC transporter substrate-binding protein [unclassified Halomonas]|uniref:ABC transporter substrate-binding protein n=1 Tax=unclassified Halomonas TaxID=2609666 RepID=UPI0021E50D3F|nr:MULTISPECIES: ABC transporter substrate-binding protein [unclassified Halomonas]UYF99757.1 ABC transporter substrate-binding protein [Halomonas sp. GD1P12]WNL39149.1 ABC transporter substrate-binding protein [Halomonas sp. PAMB 3232]
MRLSPLIARGLLLAASLLPAGAQAQWATLDWTIAETLLAIDAPIEGVAQIPAYHDWVGEPRLPDSVVDLGLRQQPNFELMAQNPPEGFLISPMFEGLTPKLSRLAPVSSFALYTPGEETWPELLSFTRQLGEKTHREAQAEALIIETDSLMERLSEQTRATSPLLMIQFMDARHVRVFGDNSLYNAVLSRLGIDNAWQEATNAWGFALTGVETLAHYPDATLVIVDPVPTGVEEELARSGLWQRLPAIEEHRVIRLAPVWSFGALPSAQRFARELTRALNDAPPPVDS